MPHVFYIIFFFALGACIGSFLNVVVWRLPRGESLVSPPSRCPICGHQLAWYDNLPVLGWLKLRGRCRYCCTPISAEYPTVEFITGALFVLYYVMFFMIGAGPCWLDLRQNVFLNLEPVHHHVESITQHWPQYLLAVFTISALLAASLIDARNFFIPQSIPILLAIVGVAYHTILDRPLQPGALNVSSGATGAIAIGGGLGLLISLLLLRTGKLKRSFAEGWPQLEIDKETIEVRQADGLIARSVKRMIDLFRRKLTPEQKRSMEKSQREAAVRDAEDLARREKEYLKAHPEAAAAAQSAPREFSRSDIRREIRKEMAFLLPPLALAMGAAALAMFLPSVGKPWGQLLAQHNWLSGLLGSLLGAMVGALVVWLTRILGSLAFGREAMGMGDVDLMFGVGAVIGAGASTVAFFVAPFFGLAIAIYMILVGRRRELPYGPYLSLGTAFVMLYYCPIAAYLAPGLGMLKTLTLRAFGVAP